MVWLEYEGEMMYNGYDFVIAGRKGLRPLPAGRRKRDCAPYQRGGGQGTARPTERSYVFNTEAQSHRELVGGGVPSAPPKRD